MTISELLAENPENFNPRPNHKLPRLFSAYFTIQRLNWVPQSRGDVTSVELLE
jgi:hypothetical protein